MPIGDGTGPQASSYHGAMEVAGGDTISSTANDITSGATAACVAFWIKFTALAGGTILTFFGKGVTADEGLRLQRRGSASDSTIWVLKDDVIFGFVSSDPDDDMVLNQWTHIAIAKDSGGTKLYINGTLVDSRNANGFETALDTNDGEPFVFVSQDGNIEYRVADFAAWAGAGDSDLPSASEIGQLANREIDPQGCTASPEFHVPMNARLARTVNTNDAEILDAVSGTDKFPSGTPTVLWVEDNPYDGLDNETDDPGATTDYTARDFHGGLQRVRDAIDARCIWVNIGDSFAVHHLGARLTSGLVRSLAGTRASIRGVGHGASDLASVLSWADLATGGTLSNPGKPDGAFDGTIEGAADGDATARYFGLPWGGIFETFSATDLSPAAGLGAHETETLERLTITNGIQTFGKNTALSQFTATGSTINWRQFVYYSGQSPHASVGVRYGDQASDFEVFDLSVDGVLGGGAATSRGLHAVASDVEIRESSGGDFQVDFFWPSFTSPADDNLYVHNAGGVAWKPSDDGIIWITLGAASASIDDFAVASAPSGSGSKSFTDARLEQLLTALRVDTSAPLLVHMHIAIGDESNASGYQSAIEALITRWDTEAEDAGFDTTRITYLWSIPPFHESADSDVAADRSNFEAAETAAKAIADSRFAWFSWYTWLRGAMGTTPGKQFALRGYGEARYTQAVFDELGISTFDPYGDGSGTFSSEFLDDGGLHVNDADTSAALALQLWDDVFALSPTGSLEVAPDAPTISGEPGSGHTGASRTPFINVTPAATGATATSIEVVVVAAGVGSDPDTDTVLARGEASTNGASAIPVQLTSIRGDGAVDVDVYAKAKNGAGVSDWSTKLNFETTASKSGGSRVRARL